MKQECINDLNAIAAKARQDYADAVSAGILPDEALDHMADVSIAANNRVLEAIAEVLAANESALGAITARLEADLERIKRSKQNLHNAVAAVQLASEMVELAAALAQRMATGGVG